MPAAPGGAPAVIGWTEATCMKRFCPLWRLFDPAAGRLSLKSTPGTCEDVNRDGFGSRIRFGKVATVDTFTVLCQLAVGGFGTAQWGD